MARVTAVRTKVSPLGRPDVTLTQSQLFEMGNQIVSVSGKLCFALYLKKGKFSVVKT